MEILQVENLSKLFGSGELEVKALSEVSLMVKPGELVALLGPSGSGKTTLLFCISLILEPTRGRITMNGTLLFEDGWTGIDVRRFRRENIGFIFQAHNLIPFLTALENVLVALNIRGIKGKEAKKKAMELLDYLDIAHRANYFPALLSSGEQQRVTIARALANNPKLILADEPTASLDTERGKSVISLLRQLAKEKKAAVIVVTHDERMVEGFNKIYHLKDGRLLNCPDPF